MTILAVGTSLDGMFYIGPFDDAEMAIEWAERNITKYHWVLNPEGYSDWEVIHLVSPEGYSD